MYDCAIVTLDSTQSNAVLVRMHEDEKGGWERRQGTQLQGKLFCSVLQAVLPLQGDQTERHDDGCPHCARARRGLGREQWHGSAPSYVMALMVSLLWHA